MSNNPHVHSCTVSAEGIRVALRARHRDRGGVDLLRLDRGTTVHAHVGQVVVADGTKALASLDLGQDLGPRAVQTPSPSTVSTVAPASSGSSGSTEFVDPLPPSRLEVFDHPAQVRVADDELVPAVEILDFRRPAGPSRRGGRRRCPRRRLPGMRSICAPLPGPMLACPTLPFVPSTRDGDLPNIKFVAGNPQSPAAPPDVDGLLALALSRPNQALTAARALLSDGADLRGRRRRPPGGGHRAARLRRHRPGARGVPGRDPVRPPRRRPRSARRTCVRRTARRWCWPGTREGLAEIERAADGAVGAAAGRIQIRLAHALWLLGRNTDMLRAAQRAVDLLSGTGRPGLAGPGARPPRRRPTSRSAPWRRADEDYARSEELFARAGQRLEYASALHDRGTTAFARGDLPAALTLLDDAQQVVDELEVFEPELDVTRVQVLLAAELHRDALRVADEAVGTQHPAARVRGPPRRAAVRRRAGGVRRR